MFCPRCRAEFREGFDRCSECDVPLVAKLPPEPAPEYQDLVTVFEGDSNAASVAKSTIENAGIECWIKDEDIQGVFPSLGPARVQVKVEDEAAALDALDLGDEDLEDGDGEFDEEDEDEDLEDDEDEELDEEDDEELDEEDDDKPRKGSKKV